MKLGIIGLPNVGKSTLFNALTKAGAESANYPFCTIDPNVGIVFVPDARLAKLEALYKAQKVTPAVIEFVDIAGLVKGAGKGEGLGNQFLSHIREVDALVHVVRCFDDGNVVHVEGNVNPLRDVETINIELIFADLEIVERRLSKIVKLVKSDKSYQREIEILEQAKQLMESGKCARELTLDDDGDKAVFASFNLLTSKPVLYAANVAEEDVASNGENNQYVRQLHEHAATEGSALFVVCAKIEAEISELTDDEKAMFLEDMGITKSALDHLIAASYDILGLLSFLTAGPKEVRAWTITKGTKAPAAAGKIHSDFERGFIRAEIVNYEDLTRLGAYNAAKEAGLVRLEGKEYVVKDGDIILFRFNV